MNARLAHWAVTALMALTTAGAALTTAGALQAAVNLSAESARQTVNASAPAIARLLVEHQQFLIIANLVASASLLIWWLNGNSQADSPPGVEAGKRCIRQLCAG